MVKKINGGGKTFFQCSECGFAYAEIGWAKKCEEWCKAHNSCNILITKHAVRI